jgi:mRNA interferase RelE/StbE
MQYELRIEKKVSKQLNRICHRERVKIEIAIFQLGLNPRPRGSIKLKGSDLYRIRVENYRILYDINDIINIIDIIAIRRRNERTYYNV